MAPLGSALRSSSSDTGLEAWDTFEEPASRRALGGLTAAEALLHVVLVTLRAELARAGARFAAGGRLALERRGRLARRRAVAGVRRPCSGLLPGAVLVAALHVTLALARRDLASDASRPDHAERRST